MSVTEREPWWASGVGPDDADALFDEQDPIDAHRTARRGVSGEVSMDDPVDGSSEREGGHDADVCGACPICLGLRALGESRPELLGHLLQAARHLSAAARTVIDEHTRAARSDADPEEQPAGGTAHPRVTRIDLD